MQETANFATWWRGARCPGILKYHLKSTGRDLIIVLLGFLGVNLLSLLLPFLFGGRLVLDRVSNSNGWTEIVLFVMAIVTANSRTRFALRFGTPRFSVWLCNIISLFTLLLAFQLASKFITALIGLVVCLLSGSNPTLFSFASFTQGGATGMELYQQSLVEMLQNIPKTALELLAWTSACYLFGCCLRKHKVITLLIVLGAPALLTILMIVPAINQGVSAYQSGDMSQIMALLYKLYEFIVKVGHWLYDNYFLVEMLVGLFSLPLSYLVMRTTKQP